MPSTKNQVPIGPEQITPVNAAMLNRASEITKPT